MVNELVSKGVAKITDLGQVVRVTSDETTVKRVRQMPEVIRSQQPTIAIITAQFCEKLAVDAMIDNKDTYVRYKVEGLNTVLKKILLIWILQILQVNPMCTRWEILDHIGLLPPNFRLLEIHVPL